MTDFPATVADQDAEVMAFGDFLDTFRNLEKVLAADLQRRSNMSHTWFDALIRIACEPTKAITMSELCASTSLTSGGVTRLVDRLVEVGYVERRASATDRRVQLAALTPDGAKALDEAALVHRENIRREFTGRLSEEELEVFLGLLQKIRRESGRLLGPRPEEGTA